MNQFFYNIVIYLLGLGMNLASLISEKAKLWVKGRKNLFIKIKNNISPKDLVIWMHAASLGEYEQGLPVFTALKEKFPTYKFVLSFFSPSGYEIIKDQSWADLVFYLPLDTKKNAEKLIKYLHPEHVIFVKYDFWFNLLQELSKHHINTIFISTIFRNNQFFFKTYGKWTVSILKKVSHFFVQNENSQKLLNSIGIPQNTISGDTRFDRVKMLLSQSIHLEWLEQFKQNKILLVAGSTWKEDDDLIEKFIHKTDIFENFKIVIAPHNMNSEYFQKLKKVLKVPTLLFSEIEGKDLQFYNVIILDMVGILTQVYSYADIAYVGGGFGKEGVHNVLEPAIFHTPVIYGPIYHKFIEAEELVNNGGGIVIHSSKDFNTILYELIQNDQKRNELGQKAQKYILNKPNSTQIILRYFKS